MVGSELENWSTAWLPYLAYWKRSSPTERSLAYMYVASRASARPVVARVIVGPQEIQGWIKQACLLEADINGIGPVSRPKTALAESDLGAAGSGETCSGMPMSIRPFPPLSKIRRMFAGWLTSNFGAAASGYGKTPLGPDLFFGWRGIGHDHLGDPVHAVALAVAGSLDQGRPRCYRGPRPRASPRGSSCSCGCCRPRQGWQPEVPHEMWATRRSPGFTNIVNSGDSWFRSVYDRTGLAVVRQASGNRGLDVGEFLDRRRVCVAAVAVGAAELDRRLAVRVDATPGGTGAAADALPASRRRLRASPVCQIGPRRSTPTSRLAGHRVRGEIACRRMPAMASETAPSVSNHGGNRPPCPSGMAYCPHKPVGDRESMDGQVRLRGTKNPDRIRELGSSKGLIGSTTPIGCRAMAARPATSDRCPGWIQTQAMGAGNPESAVASGIHPQEARE